MADKSSVVAEGKIKRASIDNKSKGKVPKKFRKSQREKSKRNLLNGHFLELGYTLEPTRQNNGKASILADAIKLLRVLIAQVDSLRKESSSLFLEARYVTVEKNELKDETITLEAEVKKLQNELRERTLSSIFLSSSSSSDASVMPTITPLQQGQAALPHVSAPVYSIPLVEDRPHSCPDSSPQIRRPHPRYPTPSDSWHHQILSQQQMIANDSIRTNNCSEKENPSSSPRELKLLRRNDSCQMSTGFWVN